MAEVIKEMVVSQDVAGNSAQTTSVMVRATKTQKIKSVVYFLFGLLEVLLAFRLFLKLAGASTASGFVRFIYGSTAIFVLPFEGIFRRGFAQGVETTSVLEPSTLVALAVYAVLMWGVVKVISIASSEPQE